MMSRWHWVLLQLGRRLWIRASLFAVLGVVTALLAAWVAPLIPLEITARIGSNAVDNILNILASSMLAVTTFSLSIMVSSYSAATQNVTPRATRLLLQDTTSQTVLSTFVGSFLFGVVGIVTLATGAYGERGRVVLFAVTLGVLVLVVVTLLRWIDHLSKFGRVEDTTERVEAAAAKALRERLERPSLGGQALLEVNEIPDDAMPVYPGMVGYVQHIDISKLSEACGERDRDLYVLAVPGSFVHLGAPIARVVGSIEDRDAMIAAIQDAFTLDKVRSFDQDPRFGLVVLAEIAARALSPGVNDPGTAIDVIGRTVRLMTLWAGGTDPESSGDVMFPSVHVPPLRVGDAFDDAFTSIARDGASVIEVQVRLQKALQAIAALGGEFETCAADHSQIALQRAEASMETEADLRLLRGIALAE